MSQRKARTRAVTLHVYDCILARFNKIAHDEFDNNKGLVQSAAMMMFDMAPAEQRQQLVDAILLAEHRSGDQSVASMAKAILADWQAKFQVTPS